VQRPKHVVSLNKENNIRQLCFDSKEPLFNYFYQTLLLSTRYFIWVQFNNLASIRCPSNYRNLLYFLPYFFGKLDNWHDYVRNLMCCFSFFIVCACFFWGWTNGGIWCYRFTKPRISIWNWWLRSDPNYSLIDYSYSDNSDNKSFSLDEINVSAVNELQNIDLMTGKENRKPKSRIKEEPCCQNGKEIKWKWYEINFKGGTEGTEIPERKSRPPCGATWTLNVFSDFSEQEKLDIFKTYWFLEDGNTQRFLNLN
jgi:hypothetical protein